MRSMNEKTMKKMVRCESCGAEFDVSLVRCPHCGAAYISAEEDEYMDKLEAVREDLNQQIDKSDKQIKKDMGSIMRTIIIVIIVILFFIFGALWLSGKSERSHSDQKKDEFLKDQGIVIQQEVTDQ